MIILYKQIINIEILPPPPPPDFMDVSENLEEHNESEPIDADPLHNLNNASLIVTHFVLKNKHDLNLLIELEEKTLIPKYKLNNNLMDSADRSCLCRLIIKNLLKANPDIE